MMRTVLINKPAAVATTVALSALLVAGCSSSDDGAGEAGSIDGRTKVVAAFYPLEWAVEQIAGDSVDVVNVTPAGAEPHDIELRPRDLDTLRDADLVIYVGGGFQPAVEDALEDLPSSVATIDVLDIDDLQLRELTDDELALEGEEEQGEDDDHEGESESGGGATDPHVWLDPVNFGSVVDAVSISLQDAGATVDADDVRTELDELDDRYRAGLETCERRDVFTTHAAFGYLGDRYDLDMTPISGVSPEAEAKPRDLERLAGRAEAAGATTIFFETLVSPDVAEALADEVGAETSVLDPLEGLTDDGRADGDDYISVMEANLRSLQEGLGCSVS